MKTDSNFILVQSCHVNVVDQRKITMLLIIELKFENESRFQIFSNALSFRF